MILKDAIERYGLPLSIHSGIDSEVLLTILKQDGETIEGRSTCAKRNISWYWSSNPNGSLAMDRDSAIEIDDDAAIGSDACYSSQEPIRDKWEAIRPWLTK